MSKTHEKNWHISWFNQSTQANKVSNQSLHDQLSFDTKFVEIWFDSCFIQNNFAKKRKTHAIEAAAEVNFTKYLFHGAKLILHGNMGEEGWEIVFWG